MEIRTMNGHEALQFLPGINSKQHGEFLQLVKRNRERNGEAPCPVLNRLIAKTCHESMVDNLRESEMEETGKRYQRFCV